ncbi:hypothetical protein NKR23_g9355 [Pleurostoma richardsiae]|uniref:Uncharacterized protein n=1 Tax=Pleurostoma richardsiae TaxID=41990 RepID=A0AA38VCB1_9PEZI|nr:hypothetical protein NKR23_g9355 [Pleurostoma richardsiae]
MKTIINLTILLAAAAGISASPAPAEQINDVITAGGNTYTGLSTRKFLTRGLEARCGENWPPHSDCVPGQCQCSAGYGCWSCDGGRFQCQPGPDSGECWT